MRRREFISLLGGAAITWPLPASAQQPAMPVVGYLSASSPAAIAHQLTALRLSLSEAGYIEGRSLAIDYRFAEGRYDRLPMMAEELVRRQVAVIIATSTTPSLVAKRATATIPIVFGSTDDPVELPKTAA